MTEKGRIQIQAVLYNNDAEELRRSMRSIDQAVQRAAAEGWAVSLIWGDASPKAVFSDKAWAAFRKEGAHLAGLAYQRFDHNAGYGGGNNLLAAGSEADYLLIMNPEILLPPEGILQLLAPFEDEDVGLTEARQIPVEHPKAFDPKTMETEWASGACFMIPTALFTELGGFDTKTFFMYCEDVDLSWRVRMAGKKLYYQAAAGVFHAHRLNEQGLNRAGQTEMDYTVLSEAMLAYKWSYPEYARERIRLAVERGDPGSRKALEAFQEMEQKGELPAFLDPEHRIAHIIQYPESGGMLFTRHRYQL